MLRDPAGEIEQLKHVLDKLKTNIPMPREQTPITSGNSILLSTKIPLERLNTKLLFRLLAKNPEKFNSKYTLQIDSFLELLDDYLSPEFPILLTEIIKYSAKLGYSGLLDAKIIHNNHLSINLNTNVISKEIAKELSLRRLCKLEKLPIKYY